jgi:hypothetical protein
MPISCAINDSASRQTTVFYGRGFAKTLDYRIHQFAKEKILGKNGFSTALRFIVPDWYALRSYPAEDKNSCE